MVPTQAAGEIPTDRPSEEAQVNAGSEFWKEREDEFLKYDTAAFTSLSATWLSTTDHWEFGTGSGGGTPPPGSEQAFKSLARLAGQGLESPRGGEPWIGWLTALRRARDRSTKDRLYSKVSLTGSVVTGEGVWEQSGQPIAPGEMVEFYLIERSEDERNAQGIAADGARIATRRAWDETDESIPALFTASANFCLELRSRTEETRRRRKETADSSAARRADPELRRKHERQIADRNALYARHNGRNFPEVERQEELLKDARAWAKAEINKIVGDLRDFEELKNQVVKQTWDEFVPKHRYHRDFQLGYRAFASALWDEGWPSLADNATDQIEKRAEPKSASRAIKVKAPASKSDWHAWAACPRASDIQNSNTPRLFKTQRAAKQFLNSKAKHPAGGHFDYKRSSKGWLAMPVSAAVVEGPKPVQTFREFWPATAVEVSDPPTMEAMIELAFADRIPEPSCYLGKDWRFEEIERNAWQRVGHAYEGRKHSSVDEVVVKAVYDLEASLFALHPQAGAASAAQFFGSWQVWRHIADFGQQIGKSKLIRRLPGDPDHVHDRVFEQLKVYVHEASSGIDDGGSPSSAASVELPINPAPPTVDPLAGRGPQVPPRNGPAWDRLRQRSAVAPTRRFEKDCPLLAQGAREKLAERAARRDSVIADLLDFAWARLEKRREESDSVEGSPQPGIAATLDQLKSEFRAEILGVAASEARDGVREFADGILTLQKRLGVHANLLREYTGCLASELRDQVLTADLFRPEPPAAWLDDPIAQKAIDTCEQIIAERKAIGDRWEYDSDEPAGTDLGPWSAVVQEWECFKAAHKIEPGPEARLEESAFRTFLGGRHGVVPTDVTWEQIRLAAAQMCRHYGAILLVPLEPSHPLMPAPLSVESAEFWKDREEEFRKHDVGDNSQVQAVWSSPDDYWRLRTASGMGSVTDRSERLLTALSRESAKGLAGGSGANDPLAYWLTALRQERWAKPEFSGSSTMPEREFELKKAALPPGSMIRFAPTTKEEASATQTPPVTGAYGIAVQRVWDTATAKIERVFSVSGDFCMEMRSRASKTVPAVPVAPPARQEIKGLADDAFGVARDRLLIEHAQKKLAALGQPGRTGNSGSLLPVLIKWAADGLTEMILALAGAYVDAFDLCGMPSDREAEKEIETQAELMAAGAIAGVRGELDLLQKRTRSPQSYPGVEQEIGRSMGLAVKEGRLRLKRQRIKVSNSASPSQRRPTPPDLGHSDPAGHSAREAGPSSDRTIAGTMHDLQELPAKFQNRFETAKAKAELEYANRSETFPHHPQFAEHPVNYILLIQKVFFAYCEEARNACREDVWSVVKARKATDAALPLICDHYFVRKHGDRAEEKKSTFRSLFTEGVFLDPKGKQHLSELVTLAEGASTGPAIKTGRNEEPVSVTTGDAPGATNESDVDATSTLTPDAEHPVAADRDRLLRAFKAKGKTLGIKVTHEMVAHAADPKWNERSMVTWWLRNDDRCKPPHDKKIRAVLGKEPSTIWPKTS